MAVFASDTFTEADGVAFVPLINHTSDSGHTWTVEGSNTDIGIDTATDQLITQEPTISRVFCLIGATPASADYSVEADITVQNTQDFTFAGVIARGQIDGSGYVAQIDANDGQVRLVRFDAGSFNLLGSAAVDLSTLPVTYNIKLEASGSTLKVFLNGSEIIGPVNDTTYTSAHSAGTALRTANAGDNYRVDNFSADDGAASTPTPTITNINTNNEFTPGAANTLNGENLSETGGSIVIDGETQTITNRTATAITFTGVRGGNPYNTDLTLTYTDADSNEVTQTVQQVPAVGFAVTAASPNTTDDASLWTGLVDTSTGNPVTVVDGDQALVTDPNSLGNLAVTPAGEISADTEGKFVVQFLRASEGVWGGDQTVTFEVPSDPDPVPEPTDLDAKKKQNKRRRYTANLFGAWRNRFIGGQDE